MEPNSDFKELLNLLNEEKVRYLIVGGYAVIHHTEPRYTKDLDIWVSTNRENAERVYTALRKFGAPLAGITLEDFQTANLVYHMGRPPARVDVLMGLKGVEFEACWSSRVEAEFSGVKTQFLSRGDLVTNKREVGRPQDLMDVESLTLAGSIAEKLKREPGQKPEQEKERKRDGEIESER